MSRLWLALSLALLALLAGAVTAQAAGESGQDLFSWGTDIYVAKDQVVERDVVCFGCSVHVDGSVGRDVFALGGNVYVDGSVGRDATALGGNLHLGSGSSVERDATAVGGSLDRSAGATVGRNATSGGRFGHPAWGSPLNPIFSPWQALPGLLLMGLALLVSMAAPRQLAAGSPLLETRPVEAGGLGCLGMIAAVVLSVFFAVTVILIPLAMVVWLVIAAAWVFGWAVVMAWAGRRILAISDPAQAGAPTGPLQVLVGGLVVAALALVPVLGGLLFLAGGTLAVGIALGTRFGTRTEGAPFYGWVSSRQPVPAPVTPEPPPPPPST